MNEQTPAMAWPDDEWNLVDWELVREVAEEMGVDTAPLPEDEDQGVVIPLRRARR